MSVKMNRLLESLTLKLIIVGDQGVGKTSLLKRYVENEFNINEKATIGADFMTKRVKVKGYDVVFQIWDTAGLERFSTLNKSFYRGADGVLIVYDVTLSESFNNIVEWKNKFLDNIQGTFDPINFTVCGNKVDSNKENIIKQTKNNITEKMKEKEIEFFSVSAKSGNGVSEKALDKYLKENAYDQEIREIFQDEVRSQVVLPGQDAKPEP